MNRKTVSLTLAIVLLLATTLHAQKKPVIPAPSLENDYPPPDGAMALSIPQARTAMKEAVLAKFVGTMRYCFLMVCVTQVYSEASDIQFSPRDFSYVAAFTMDNQSYPGKVLIDFKQLNGSYVYAFRVAHLSCSTGSCYGIRSFLKLKGNQSWGLGPLWDDEASAEKFANGLNRLLYAYVHSEGDNELATFSAAAKAWRENPAMPPLTSQADRHRILAENAIQEKNLDSAIEHYESALEVQPMWPAFWFNLGMLYAEQNDFASAADRMKHYLELVPDAPDAQDAHAKMIIWEDKAGK